MRLRRKFYSQVNFGSIQNFGAIVIRSEYTPTSHANGNAIEAMKSEWKCDRDDDIRITNTMKCYLHASIATAIRM